MKFFFGMNRNFNFKIVIYSIFVFYIKMLTNDEVFKMLEKQTICEVAHALFIKFWNDIGTEASVKS